MFYLDTLPNPTRVKYLTRQVEQARNDANNGWVPRVFTEKENTTCNKGFDDRKLILGRSSIVNCEIPLNRYSFFATCVEHMLPDANH